MALSGFDLLNAGTSLAGIRVARDIAYGPAARQAFDVYYPDGPAAPRPVAVWFYGGAWQSGRRRDYRFVAAALASRGIVCAVADYRLFPEVAFPDFLRDAARAVVAVRRRAADWGGDPARVFAVGHSAGAYMAVMLALSDTYLPRDSLAGAVGIAGPFDFLPIRDPDIQAVFAPAADPRDTQPIAAVDGRNPPLLLLHGNNDRTCYPRNSIALATRIRARGGNVMLRTYPLTGHIGIVLGFAPLFRWRSPVLADVTQFIARSWAGAQARAIQPAA